MDWWNAFKTEYEARWGAFPMASEGGRNAEYVAIWARELKGLEEGDVVPLCAFVAERMKETGAKGKPRIANFQGQLDAMKRKRGSIVPFHPDSYEAAKAHMQRPLFDMRKNPPSRIRAPFLCELPAEMRREVWRLIHGTLDGKVEPENAKQGTDAQFKVEWADYSEEEKKFIRLHQGRSYVDASK